MDRRSFLALRGSVEEGEEDEGDEEEEDDVGGLEPRTGDGGVEEGGVAVVVGRDGSSTPWGQFSSASIVEDEDEEEDEDGGLRLERAPEDGWAG